jgi:hypothetical protein
MQNANKKWQVSDNTNFDVQTTPTKLFELTIDEALEADKATYLFAAMVSNQANAKGYLRMQLKVSGSVVSEEMVTVGALESQKTIIFNQVITSDIPSGTTFEVWLYEQGSNLILNGGTLVTSLTLEKQVDVVREVTINRASIVVLSKTRNFNKESIDYIPMTIAGNKPTDAEIRTALSNIGVNAPYDFSNAIFKAGGKKFLIYYIPSLNKFLYERLTTAQ